MCHTWSNKVESESRGCGDVIACCEDHLNNMKDGCALVAIAANSPTNVIVDHRDRRMKVTTTCRGVRDVKSAWGAGQLGGKSNKGLVLQWCRLSGVSSASMCDPCILCHVPSTAFTPSNTAHQTYFSPSALFRSVALVVDLIRVCIRISPSVILVTFRMV